MARPESIDIARFVPPPPGVKPEMVPPTTGGTILDLDPEGKDLLIDVVTDPHFNDILLMEIHRARQIPRVERVPFLRGVLWEQLAYRYVKNGLLPNQAVLSPAETNALFNHPYLYEAAWPQFPSTIPDGILFEEREGTTYIRGACEYTVAPSLRGGQKSKQRKLHRTGQALRELFQYQPEDWQLALADFVHSRFPQLPPILRFDEKKISNIFVTPRGDSAPPSVSRGVVTHPPVTVKQMNILTHALLKDFNIKYRQRNPQK